MCRPDLPRPHLQPQPSSLPCPWWCGTSMCSCPGSGKSELEQRRTRTFSRSSCQPRSNEALGKSSFQPRPIPLLPYYQIKSNPARSRVWWQGENQEAWGCTILPGISAMLHTWRVQDIQLSLLLVKYCKQKTAWEAVPVPGLFGNLFPRNSSEMVN